MISAGRARRHLLKLRAAGIGTRQVSTRAGVSRRVVLGILDGSRARCTQLTEDSIRRVTVNDKAAGQLVAASRAHAWVDDLLAAGWTRRRIATALGRSSLQLGRGRIRRSTRDALESLVDGTPYRR